MTAVQPFSYLTVQPPPSKPAFQRQDDPEEIVVSAGGFRSGDPNTQEDVGHLSHSIATLPFQGDYQRPQVNLGRAQTETGYDLRQHQQQQQQAEATLRQQQQQQAEVALRQQQQQQAEVALRQQQQQQQQQEVALRQQQQQQQQEAALRQQQQQQQEATLRQQQQQEVALRQQQQQEVALRQQQQQQQQEVALRQQQQQEATLRQQQLQLQQEVTLRQQQQQQEATLRQQQQQLQQEVTLRQQQQQKPEVAYIENRVKRPPDVAPKHTKAADPRMPENNWESSKEEGGFHGATKGGALYSQTNPLTLERIQEKTEPVGDPDFGNAGNLYGQPNRNRGSDGQDARKVSSQYAPPNDVPFSYTQPLGLSGGVAYGDMESRNGVGAKHEVGNRPRDSPAVSSIENQTIFENFILVGPEKPQTREAAPKEQPVKRLKLQELFDPPPQQAPAAAKDPRKLSIFGVTNTESSDYHSSNHSKPRDSSDRTKTKAPVSTFDNPDYNFQDRPYTPSGSLQGMSDERPWSIGANNTLDGAGKNAAAGASKQRRPKQERSQSNKMCIAVLITAIVTGLFCLGAGFIAGWFGRGRALGC